MMMMIMMIMVMTSRKMTTTMMMMMMVDDDDDDANNMHSSGMGVQSASQRRFKIDLKSSHSAQKCTASVFF